MNAPACVRGGERTCIAAFAEGWINPPDLCSGCTATFMVALDSVSGPLHWHEMYTSRAGVSS